VPWPAGEGSGSQLHELFSGVSTNPQSEVFEARHVLTLWGSTCVTGFTAGQATRMVSNWNQFRVGK